MEVTRPFKRTNIKVTGPDCISASPDLSKVC